MIDTVKIVKIYPTKFWVEKDFMGSSHIMMQHDCPGQEPFQYASFFYDYAYTSNSGIHSAVVKMMKSFGVEEADIVWKNRETDYYWGQMK